MYQQKNDKEIGLVETVQAYSFDSLNEVVEFLSGNEKEPVKPSIEIDFAKLYQDLENIKVTNQQLIGEKSNIVRERVKKVRERQISR